MICAWCASTFGNTHSRIVFWPNQTEQPRFIYARGSDGVREVLALWAEFPEGWLDIEQNRIHDWMANVQIEGTLVCAVHAFAELQRRKML